MKRKFDMVVKRKFANIASNDPTPVKKIRPTPGPIYNVQDSDTEGSLADFVIHETDKFSVNSLDIDNCDSDSSLSPLPVHTPSSGCSELSFVSQTPSSSLHPSERFLDDYDTESTTSDDYSAFSSLSSEARFDYAPTLSVDMTEESSSDPALSSEEEVEPLQSLGRWPV